MKTILRVFDIERFAIHDGPGIRTTVFFKGCPMRCPWCANPESQSLCSQRMYRSEKCTGCGLCAAVCPHGAVVMRASRPAHLHCRLCGECVRVCPTGALRIAGEDRTVGEVLHFVLRDRAYYEQSGGGVTISGGEPFVQHEGLIALLEQCRSNGVHTAVETCGDVNSNHFAASFGLVDCYLFDVKHADADKLRSIAGGNLPQILHNLDAVVGYDPNRVIVRVPVIPGFNDGVENVGAIFRLARERGIRRVHLLPSHGMGANKYAALGMNNPMPQLPTLQKDALLPLCKLGEAMGLVVQAGA